MSCEIHQCDEGIIIPFVPALDGKKQHLFGSASVLRFAPVKKTDCVKQANDYVVHFLGLQRQQTGKKLKSQMNAGDGKNPSGVLKLFDGD